MPTTRKKVDDDDENTTKRLTKLAHRRAPHGDRSQIVPSAFGDNKKSGRTSCGESGAQSSRSEHSPNQYCILSRAVMLQIKLEVVSRPGVLFSNCNAARHDAVLSTSPSVVDFAAVKAKNQFAVADEKRHLYQAEVLVPSPLQPDLIVFPEEQKEKPFIKARERTTKPSAAPSAEVKIERGDLPKPASPTQEIALLPETLSCTAVSRTTVTTSSHTLDDGMASLVSCDRAGSLVGCEGGKLITKFDPWMLLLFLRCLAEMCTLDETSGFDPFRRFRMCKTHMLLKAFKLQPLGGLALPRDDLKQRCEFACPDESIGVTDCCGRRQCSYHKRQKCCCCKKARTSAEATPRVIVQLCSLAREPPRPNCATCKYSVCPRHQTQCKNEAFSACHFCLKFNCERGECAKTICCVGVLNHLKKFGKQPSPAKKLSCTKDAVAATCITTPGASLSNCSADLARGHAPLLNVVLRPATPATPVLPAKNAAAVSSLCTTDPAAACMTLTCALLCPRTCCYAKDIKIGKEKNRKNEKIEEIIRKFKILIKSSGGSREATDAYKITPDPISHW